MQFSVLNQITIVKILKNKKILILGLILTTICIKRHNIGCLKSDLIVIRFTTKFRTKEFCYFWNTITILQQNKGEK